MSSMSISRPTSAERPDADVLCPQRLLIALIAVDLLLMSLHCFNAVVPWMDIRLLSIEKDVALPEGIQYIKWGAIVVVLYQMAKRISVRYFAWAALFTYLLLDDALKVHENLGKLTAGGLTWLPTFGLRYQDLGELLVSGCAGVGLLLAIAWAWYRSDAAFRKASRHLLLLFGGLVGFGIGVDMLHSLVDHDGATAFWFGLVEDGGEMLVASVMVWYVVRLEQKSTRLSKSSARQPQRSPGGCNPRA